MSTTSGIEVPLFSRASDRSIEECSFRWHAERSGRPVDNCSWFDIGSAMHEVYELGIERKWKTPRPYVQHGIDTVLRYVEEGKKDAMNKGVDYLESRHRPTDPESLALLAEGLALAFFDRVVENPPDWLPGHIYWKEWKTEVNIVQPSKGWDHVAGASTTTDALWTAPHRTVVVDWKTGRSRKSDPMQLQFYRYLLELQGYEFMDDQVWGAFFHAEHGTWQIVDEYDPEAVEHLIGTSQALKRAMPEATPSWLCDYCPARRVCPAFAGDPYEADLLQQMAEHRRSQYVYLLDPL